MDKTKLETALQSRTMRMVLLALIGMAAKWLAIPMLPDDVSNEVIFIVLGGADLAISGAIAAAGWFRMKARKIIDRWL